MTDNTNLDLDRIGVAAPCPASWENMTGDDRKRFCAECKLHVYNLSGMGRAEATQLIASSEGRLCVRFFRRADGTVLTRDCPVGLRQRMRKAWARAVALTAGLWAGLLGCSRRGEETGAGPDDNGGVVPGKTIELRGEVCVPEREPLMGIVCPEPEPKPEPKPDEGR